MTDPIFENEALQYWKRDLPVIPVEGKIPVIVGWTGLLGSTPSDAKQIEWLRTYRDKNLGLLLGFDIDSRTVMVALDADDDRLWKPLLRLLGLNRAERRAVLSGKRGKKGGTVFVRAPKAFRSTVLKGAGGLGNIDVLAAGKMTVMPPSIHPETGKPYEVYGKPFLEIEFTDLPEINERFIKLLKVAIGSEHAIVLISGKATHDAGVALAGVLVNAGATDEEITTVISGLLPEGYAGNSLEELPEWIESARVKGFDESAAKGRRGEKQSTEALTGVLASGIHLFKSTLGEAFVEFSSASGRRICAPIQSSAFQQWVRYQHFTATSKSLAQTALREVIDLLEAKALFEGPTETVHIRLAGHNGQIYIDLGRSDATVVCITREGWHLTGECPVHFWQPPGMGELPVPESKGDLSELKDLLGLDENGYVLLLAFLIGCLNPDGPYMMLLVQGEQGSGKSFLCSLIKRLLDPSAIEKLRLPGSEHDLAIQASQNRLLIFDNASIVKADMSDALCALATGSGFSTRRYYTDNESRTFKHVRPIVINGIGDFAHRPDLLERAIQLKLRAMPVQTRKTERQLNEVLEQVIPSLLAALLDAASYALRTISDIDPPTSIRMADAAAWLAAAEPATDLTPGTFLRALEDMQADMMADRAVNDPTIIALLAVVEKEPTNVFLGTMGGLHRKLLELEDRINPRLPPTASHLSNALQRLNPMMQRIGLRVEFLERTRQGRKVRVTLEPQHEPEP